MPVDVHGGVRAQPVYFVRLVDRVEQANVRASFIPFLQLFPVCRFLPVADDDQPHSVRAGERVEDNMDVVLRLDAADGDGIRPAAEWIFLKKRIVAHRAGMVAAVGNQLDSLRARDFVRGGNVVRDSLVVADDDIGIFHRHPLAQPQQQPCVPFPFRAPPLKPVDVRDDFPRKPPPDVRQEQAARHAKYQHHVRAERPPHAPEVVEDALRAVRVAVKVDEPRPLVGRQPVPIFFRRAEDRVLHALRGMVEQVVNQRLEPAVTGGHSHRADDGDFRFPRRIFAIHEPLPKECSVAEFFVDLF